MDSYEKETCPECNGLMEITYEHWTENDLAIPNHGRCKNELTDHDGKRKMFKASEDPVCSIELGLIDDPASRGLRTFTPEQAQHFRNRLIRDKDDSPTMRREILRARADNEKAKGIVTGYDTM
jgi:hypothetical protein